MRHWTWLVPVLALAMLPVALVLGVGTILAVVCGAALVGAVLVAVHHAEVLEAKLGQPLGTLVLTIAVTCIEVSILGAIVTEGDANPTVARETIFSAIMIVCNGRRYVRRIAEPSIPFALGNTPRRNVRK